MEFKDLAQLEEVTVICPIAPFDGNEVALQRLKQGIAAGYVLLRKHVVQSGGDQPVSTHFILGRPKGVHAIHF